MPDLPRDTCNALYHPGPGLEIEACTYKADHTGNHSWEELCTFEKEQDGYRWACVRVVGHKGEHDLSQMLGSAGEQPAAKPPLPSAKQDLLEEALRIVTGPRQQLYGKPSQNLIDTAEIASGYLHARGLLPQDKQLAAYDIAILMICLKMARIATSPLERDHWVDIDGYGACGYEAAVEIT